MHANTSVSVSICAMAVRTGTASCEKASLTLSKLTKDPCTDGSFIRIGTASQRTRCSEDVAVYTLVENDEWTEVLALGGRTCSPLVPHCKLDQRTRRESSEGVTGIGTTHNGGYAA